MWNMVPPYLQVVVLVAISARCWAGGDDSAAPAAGRQSHDELPYPEGTACAEVLRATVGGSTASGVDLQRHGARRGNQDGRVARVSHARQRACASSRSAEGRAGEWSSRRPSLASGFILGYRQSGVLVAGSLVSAIVLTPLIAMTGAALIAPLFPEATKLVADMSANEIWARYVRYVGAGAVAAGGIITVVRGAADHDRRHSWPWRAAWNASEATRDAPR